MDAHFTCMDSGVSVKFDSYKRVVQSDLHRYLPGAGISSFLRLYRSQPGFRYSFWMRTAYYLKGASSFIFPLYVVSRMVLKHLEYKFGISIPYNMVIGPGFYIGHFGGIVVNSQCRIGANCNINHGVTIGATYGGKHPGVPVIGNGVYIGPGAMIIGGITIGDNVAIGAGSIVTKSLVDNAVAAGNPARVLSYKGSVDYIVNKV
ncbi:MAG: DapH/DapD/GlmU-related protein [Desulfatitalea sp.]